MKQSFTRRLKIEIDLELRYTFAQSKKPTFKNTSCNHEKNVIQLIL